MDKNIKETIELMMIANANPQNNLTRFDGESTHSQTIEELAELNREKLIDLCELLGYDDLLDK